MLKINDVCMFSLLNLKTMTLSSVSLVVCTTPLFPRDFLNKNVPTLYFGIEVVPNLLKYLYSLVPNRFEPFTTPTIIHLPTSSRMGLKRLPRELSLSSFVCNPKIDLIIVCSQSNFQVIFISRP